MDTTAPPPSAATIEPFSPFLERFRLAVENVFRHPKEGAQSYLSRGFHPSELRSILATRPLSTFVPSRFGGRGAHVPESLAVLETASYESLAASLTLGINGALFLQPVAKYGSEPVQGDVFRRILEHQNMGGLMMTEPGHGSDALNMATSWTATPGGYRIEGRKHWAGLTGLADFWLMTARERSADGRLGRDVDFFVCDVHEPDQAIEVEERFASLGLYPIPYGVNRVDVVVPDEQRLLPERSGLKMMLDLLHRSRVQFPGMGMGFVRRLADEALDHVRERAVGGRSLWSYDQVRARIADLQTSVTVASAMCVYASERASILHDLSKEGLGANVVKAVLTDRMQDAAQSFLQLVGAKGYRLDHLAGRAVVDSRPFQIFEGSNDILYEQIGAAALQSMRRVKETHLGRFLATFELGRRAAERVVNLVDVRIDGDMTQRRLVAFGQAIGRIATMEMVIDLGDRGYPAERVAAAVEQLRGDVAQAFSTFHVGSQAQPSDEPTTAASWMAHVQMA